MTEDEMVGWHHQLDGHRSGWTLGVGDGQGGLACCDSQGHKESDTTERLNFLFLFFPSLYFFIYLAAPGLGSSMWNPIPLRWECRGFATGPPASPFPSF